MSSRTGAPSQFSLVHMERIVVKNLARLSFLITTALWGSYYAVTKAALVHLDPVIFTFFETGSVAPIAITLVILYRGNLNKKVFQRGIVLGSWLCLAMLTVAIAEEYTTATNTAFFPSLGGVTAAIIAGIFLKRPLVKEVWIAGGFSFIGTLIILFSSGGELEIRGDLIALLGALFFTMYFFLVDHEINDPSQKENLFWLILGVEHLTIFVEMAFLALLFGDWQHTQFVLHRDIAVIVYVGTSCTFLPVVLTNSMQRYIGPMEAAFISILEPLWGALFAHLYLGEVVSFPIYIGGGFIIGGTLLHIWYTSLHSSFIKEESKTQRRTAKLFHKKASKTQKMRQEALFKI